MIRQTLRSLFRQKAFSVSVAAITALGVGANAAGVRGCVRGIAAQSAIQSVE
jgi:hypothetical protein